MSDFAPRFAGVLLALALTVSGVTMAAAGSAPTLPGPITPFGCYA